MLNECNYLNIKDIVKIAKEQNRILESNRYNNINNEECFSSLDYTAKMIENRSKFIEFVEKGYRIDNKIVLNILDHEINRARVRGSKVEGNIQLRNYLRSHITRLIRTKETIERVLIEEEFRTVLL